MNKTPLLIATTNPGKKKEIENELIDFSFRLLSLADLNIKEIFPETGTTFLENARGKSLFYSKIWQGLTLAEDSGLEIDCLNNAPGVFSARFSGLDATDSENNEKVLRLLEQVPDSQRKARFVCTMVLSLKGKVETEIQACVYGSITRKERGGNGFGYDPIFFFPPMDKTFGQLTGQEKNRVSHRGQALVKLKTFLSEYVENSPIK